MDGCPSRNAVLLWREHHHQEQCQNSGQGEAGEDKGNCDDQVWSKKIPGRQGDGLGQMRSGHWPSQNNEGNEPE